MSKFDIKNMNLYYGSFHALKNVNIDINENEITAFIGSSGCGKSTLLKSLNRMNDLVEGCKINGKILLDGEDIYDKMDVNLLRKREHEIDVKEKSIEAMCLKLILHQQPVASDLRAISSALKMITDMERIGDQSCDIAEIVKIHDISEQKNNDIELAQSVIDSDDIVDDLFIQVKDDTIELIANDRSAGEKAVDILIIAKYLERIGNHTTNIAEWVVFAISKQICILSELCSLNFGVIDKMIYYAEDDTSICELVIYTLRNTGFENGAELFNAVNNELPQLILLDIMLPDEDGISILSRIRADFNFRNIPVIMVTAKSTEYDKITGLDMGADDYIAKSFKVMELISRIKAVLRRAGNADTENFLVYKNIQINQKMHIVTVDDIPVELALKEYELLAALIKNKGTVLTRDMLLESIWGYDFNGETRTVYVHVRTLRSKIGDNGDIIETVRGVGYRIGGVR